MHVATSRAKKTVSLIIKKKKKKILFNKAVLEK